jgi:hypothetical protein
VIAFEVADKIPHPSAAGFWFTSIVLGAGLAGLALFTGRRWPCLVVAGTWFVGTGLWSASFILGLPPCDGIHAAFVEEMGTGYFVSLLCAAIVPALAVIPLRRSPHVSPWTPMRKSVGLERSGRDDLI